MTSMVNHPEAGLPWYRQRWPIFVFALPAIAVIASFITLWIAVKYGDGVVSGDAYKEGLAINRSLTLDNNAYMAHMHARLDIAPSGEVRVLIEGRPETLHSQAAVLLRMRHPSAPDRDQAWHGRLTSALDSEQVTWQLSLEAENWRLAGPGMLGHGAPVQLVPMAPAE